MVREHCFFAGGFGVPFEQNAGAIVVETQDERVVIDGRAAVRVGRFGSEDGGAEIGPGEGFASVEVADDHVLRAGLGEQSVEERGVAGIDADPKLAGMEIAEDGGHASHVVGVRVGEEDDVEVANAARPEVGCNDFFADIPRAGRSVFAATGGSSCVNQHGFARGADDEDRIALAYVDGRDF